MRGFTRTPIAALRSGFYRFIQNLAFLGITKALFWYPTSERRRRMSRLVSGFTLVEMIVVLMIIVTVTSIALTGQSTFNRATLLNDAAYTVALSMREMQTLGQSSRKTQSGVQNAGYGGYFTPSSKSYVLYADTAKTGQPVASNCQVGTVTEEQKPGDCIYTANSDQIVQTYNLERGFTISQICGHEKTTGNPLRCSTDTPTALTALTVTFLRSTTEAAFLGFRGTGWVQLSDAHIYLKSPDSTDTRAICLTSVGQISVVGANCP